MTAVITRARSSPWVVIAGTAVHLLATLLATIVVVRSLDTAGAAVYLVAVSTVAVLSGLTQIGLNRMAVRDIGAALAADDRTDALAVGWTVVRVATVAAAVGTVLAVPALHLLVAADADESAAVLFGVGAWLFVDSVRLVVAEVHRGWHDQAMASVTGNPVRSLLFLALVAVASTSDRLDAAGVIALAVIASVTTTILGLGALWRRGRGPAARPRPGLVTAGFLVAVVAAGNQLLNQGDLLVAGALLDAVDVARYGAALRVVAIVGTLQIVANTVLAPRVVPLLHPERRDELERVLRASALLVTVPVVAVATAVVLFGRPVLEIAFGTEYGDGRWVLAVLTIGLVVRSATGSVGLVLLLAGHERAVVRVTVRTVVVVLALEIGFGVLFGPAGVAVASSVGVAGGEIVLALVGRRLLGITSWVGPRMSLRRAWHLVMTDGR